MRAHLREAADLAVDEIVGEMHEERLVADGMLRAEHGVAEPERHALTHEDARRFGRDDVADELQQVVLTGLGELALELGIGVEVILDRALRRARDEDQPIRAGVERFFDGVLDQRLVDDRQHLLRRRLRRRQKARSSTRDRKHGCSNAWHRSLSVTVPEMIPNAA